MERADGYKGLVASYNLHFAEAPRIMSLGLITRALKERQVDLIAGAGHFCWEEQPAHYAALVTSWWNKSNAASKS